MKKVTIQRSTRRNWLAVESIFKEGENIPALLHGWRDIAPDNIKHVRAILGAEAAGYFLMQLYHADVAFGQIVVKRHAKVKKKSERLLLEIF